MTALISLALAGCVVHPQPLTREALRNAASTDRAAVAKDVPPLDHELSLAEAIARALKYNLDHRTRVMEQAYAASALKASYFDLLPKLAADASYTTRDNDPIRRSVDSITGQPDQSHPFISSDRTHTVSDLGISWSALDFGVSYFNAQQQANRMLVASERRRKAVHQLIQAVRGAYWRALSAQKLTDQVQRTIAEAEAALTDARRVEAERVKAPVESLRYQRTLLENLRTLESVQQELAVARLEVAGLVNLPLSTSLRLAEAPGAEQLPAISAPVENLESIALENNADLREEHYNGRIAALEARKALVRLLPSLDLRYGTNHDTDTYLINQGWTEAAIRASANLLNVFDYPRQKALARSAQRVADVRRQALEMALITQVHVAVYQFDGARQQFERADAIWQVDERMLTLAESGDAARTDSKLNLVANHTSAILSLLRRYQALANLHAAAGKMQTTLGLEPAIENLDTVPLPDLIRGVEKNLLDWQILDAAGSG